MLTLVQRNLWIFKCQMADLHPDAVVLVATVRALKIQWWSSKKTIWQKKNIDALSKGIVNLENISRT